MATSKGQDLEKNKIEQEVEDDDEDEGESSADSDPTGLELAVGPETASEHERALFRRRLILVRNGESIDNVFSDWMKRAFVKKRYRAYDQNMPATLPQRSGAPFVFATDSPLSMIGSMVARLIGRQFKAERILTLISSPALRCLETAKWMATEMASASDFDALVPICVEPAIFDWIGRYGELLPAWMKTSELKANGYVISHTYRAIDQQETCEHRNGETAKQYRRRMDETVQNLVELWPGHGDIILVTHGVTIDCMLRGLLNDVPQSNELDKMYPRGCIVVLEQSEEDHSWTRISDALPPLTSAGFTNRTGENEVQSKEKPPTDVKVT